MRYFSVAQLFRYAAVLVVCILTCIQSAPTGALLKGTPYLFTTYNIAVDPNRGSQLAPSFQAANGAFGANLVASFGTGITP